MGSVVENYVEVLADDVTASEEVKTVPAGRNVRHEKCKVCGVWYPRDEMTRFRGAWYCFEFGCADDIRYIILNEQAKLNSVQSAIENDPVDM